MRHVIFSDVHANLEAFEAFLKAADVIRADAMHSLGDIVGYGGSPSECMDLLMRRHIPSVSGNHDDVVAGKYEPDQFNPDARNAILWCRGRISGDQKSFLLGLDDSRWISTAKGTAMLVHGSPRGKNEYVMSRWHAERAFAAMMDMDIATAFVGHTHQACCWIQQQDGRAVFRPQRDSDRELVLEPALKAIINVGSVGQPRDGNPKGCFVVWDDARHLVEFHRFKYNIEKARQRILDAGLPVFLAERLTGGF